MQDIITTMFCLCDDFLKANGCFDVKQCRVSTAEIMVVPLVACAFFGGNLALSRRFLFEHGYFQNDLSASRFCRRLHAIPKELWRSLFRILGEVFVRCNPTSSYVGDSLPVPVCDNLAQRAPASKAASCFPRNSIVAASPANAAFSLVSRCIS
jgi:hypothetical protein